MKFTPFQLAALAIGGFAAIVGLNILAQARGNAEFRDKLLTMKPEDLLNVRKQRVAEELMEAVPTEASNDSATESDDDE